MKMRRVSHFCLIYRLSFMSLINSDIEIRPLRQCASFWCSKQIDRSTLQGKIAKYFIFLGPITTEI